MLVTAIGTSLPPRASATTGGTAVKPRRTSPPSSAVIAGPAPLYGTAWILALVMLRNSSPDKWPAVPIPGDAKGIGAIFDCCRMSCIELTAVYEG